MEHEVVCPGAARPPGPVTERHPGKVLEAVVRLVGENDGLGFGLGLGLGLGLGFWVRVGVRGGQVDLV